MVLPVLVGVFFYRITSAMKRTEVESFLEVPFRAILRPSEAAEDGQVQDRVRAKR